MSVPDLPVTWLPSLTNHVEVYPGYFGPPLVMLRDGVDFHIMLCTGYYDGPLFGILQFNDGHYGCFARVAHAEWWSHRPYLIYRCSDAASTVLSDLFSYLIEANNGRNPYISYIRGNYAVLELCGRGKRFSDAHNELIYSIERATRKRQPVAGFFRPDSPHGKRGRSVRYWKKQHHQP